MGISTELMDSYERFKNKRVFQELVQDLFDAVKTVLSPITRNNSDLALAFSTVRNVTSRSTLIGV